MNPMMVDIGRIVGLVLIASLVVSAIALAVISCLIRRGK